MFENGKEMLQILEGNNFIRPTFDERMKLPEILEAAKDAEDDLDLDEAISEADDEIKTIDAFLLNFRFFIRCFTNIIWENKLT